MKIIAFTVADKNHLKHAKKLQKSWNHFHSDTELRIYDESVISTGDDWYRQKPLIARQLIKDHDLVIGFDADQIVTGNLDYIFEADYDVGTVLNFNRVDVKKYGNVSVFPLDPTEYFNAGLVALRSEKFVNHWWRLCTSRYFNRFQYREQDILNILCHFGEYTTDCFDYPSKEYSAWHGLISKGEYAKMIMRDGKLVLPKAPDKYPEKDKEIKVLHMAGGKDERAIGDCYKLYFSEEVVSYIEGLIS